MSDLIKKAMSELGTRSAEKKKKKDPDYWTKIRLKGAAARRKKAQSPTP